jgi:hypothetical protein
MITRLWGVLLDLDPILFRRRFAPAGEPTDARHFFEDVVEPWLSRHDALRDAEVVATGCGLHVIIWFEKPLEFETDADRQRWAGVVKAVQATLPVDPDMPGITATTRAVGSVNTKNGAKVVRLRRGKSVEPEVVLDLFDQLRERPFRTVASILFGSEQIEPCPVCGAEGSSLGALDHQGRCYGSCGKVELARLYDVFLKPRPTTKAKH